MVKIKIDPRDITTMKKQKLNKARKNLKEQETFSYAVSFFMEYSFAELDYEDVKKIVCQSLLYTSGSLTMLKLLRTSEDEFRYLQILDDIFASIFNNDIEKEYEKEMKQLTVDRLHYLIERKAKVFKIDLKKHNFYCTWKKLFGSLKNIYHNWSSNIFELCASYALKGADEHRQLEFLQIICEENVSGWSKYFEDSLTQKMKICEDSDLEANSEIKNPCYNTFCNVEDSTVECKFRRNDYKFITVVSAEALKIFINVYLSNAKIIGIDCEFGRSKNNVQEKYVVTVLQLSTEEWFCLIDIQELCQKLTTTNILWTKFFKELFGSKKLSIGFAFFNDFEYLCKTFPWLQKDCLLKYENKVLCLQKLTDEILSKQQNRENHEYANFFSENINYCCSLAKLSKEILGYQMDKSMQISDWAQRPLTPFQKVYAVLDALICVLIYNELQQLLQEKIGENDAEEIIKKGFIRYY